MAQEGDHQKLEHRVLEELGGFLAELLMLRNASNILK